MRTARHASYFRPLLSAASLLLLQCGACSQATQAHPRHPQVQAGAPEAQGSAPKPIHVPTVAITESTLLPTLLDVCSATETLDDKVALLGIAGLQDIRGRMKKQDVVDALTRFYASPTRDTLVPAVASISWVRDVCGKLTDFGKLTAEDIDMVRAFRDDAELSARATSLSAKLNSLSEKVDPRSLAGQVGQGEIGVLATPALGALGPKLVEGLGEFLVTRAKAEAALYLKKHLTSTVCADPRVAPYLENLCRVLTTLDPKLPLNAVGSVLRSAAERDLERLPEMGLMLGERDDRAAIALFALSFIREVREGRHALELAASYHELACVSSAPIFSARVDPIVCGSSRIIHAIIAQKEWSRSATAGRSSKAANALALSVMLTYERMSGGSPVLDGALLKSVQPTLLGVLESAAPVATQIFNLYKDPSKFGTLDRVNVTMRTLALLEGVGLVAQCVIPTARTACHQGPILANLDLVVDFTERLFARDMPGVMTSGTALLASLRSAAPPGALDNLYEVLPLVTEMANASSSKDVAAAIEAASAPVGSYEAKFERATVAVNAFVGGSFGAEVVKPSASFDSAPVIGVFAPVGLHITKPFYDRSMHGGVMVSVFDLGTVVSARLESETVQDPSGETTTVDAAPTVGVAQVVSPGLYLTLGIARAPIVIGFGAALSPDLRQAVTKRQATEDVVRSEDLAALRIQGFLAADLTLLPF